MKNLVLYLILIVALSCKSKTKLYLPSDSLETAPDHILIQEKISTKNQKYILKKEFYKSNQRRQALKKIQAISKNGMELFVQNKISRKKHDQLQNEAKYVIQHAIYRMKTETYNDQDDPILDYLNTGIKTLNEILNQQ